MLYPQRNHHRDLISLDGLWNFQPEKTPSKQPLEFGLTEPRKLAVPGSWNGQCADLSNFFGNGWYEYKDLSLPKHWLNRRVWMRIGSVNHNAQVWLNGEILGEHRGGSLPFEFELTGKLRPQGNHIIVKVDGHLDAWGLPPAQLECNEGRVGFFNSNPAVTYDFFPFCGIHRSVFLYSTECDRVSSVALETEIEGTTGVLNYEIGIDGSETDEVQLRVEDIQVTVPITDDRKASGSLEIPNARIWDLLKPELYNLEITLLSQGEAKDQYTQRFGVRTVRVEGDQFLLNEKPVFFKGYGRHEDFPILGKANHPAVIVRDFELMKWTGANSFRTSHYPYEESWLDMADEQGFLVISETPFVGLNGRMFCDEILQKALPVIEELIIRDRNHPSVVMWSLANEPNADSDEAEDFFKQMALKARSLDSTRPLTYAAHLEVENNRGMPYYDIVCINKYHGWYYRPGNLEESLDDFEDLLDEFHTAFKKPILLAEFGADAIAGLHSEPSEMFSEEFQADVICKKLSIVEKLSYCIGAHVWNFADFKTAQSISRIIFNRKGVFTRDRRPKMAAHKLRELWVNPEKD